TLIAAGNPMQQAVLAPFLTQSKYPHLKLGTREGTLVKEGELLFLIDPRQYQAELEKAEGTLFQAQARKNRLHKDFARATELHKKNSMSDQDYDLITGDYKEAQANLKVAKANRDLAKINLDYTRVTAPFTGLVSRRLVDPGNLVKADDTTLTT